MRSIGIVTAAAVVFATVSTAKAASPVAVTTCGQIVIGVGALSADLNCAAEAGDTIHLSGRLLLNGFTLTGHPAFDVVRCETGACRIVGPGTVTGGLDGVRSDRGARIEAGAIVTGNAGDGVRTDKTAKVIEATVTANGGDGVRSKTTAVLTGATITGNGGDGVRTDGTAVVKSSTVSGNGGNGIDSDKTAKAMKLSTVSGNGFDGVRGVRAMLLDSTATGNGTDPACDVTDDCADLASALVPKVKGASSCGTSRNTELGGSWSVCAGD